MIISATVAVDIENDDDDVVDDDPLECAQRVFCDAGIVSKVKP